jgi:uncharacterized protein (TIGR03067 family)
MPNTSYSLGLVMSRVLIVTVFAGLMGGCGGTQPAPRHSGDAGKVNEREAEVAPLATERDREALQGKWELVSLKRDWAEANEPPCEYVFEGATMTVSPRDRRPSYYTLKLDAAKSPKEIDFIATWEDGTVTKVEAIYELDGDTFRWCHVDGKRPREFLSERNPAGTLTVVRRVNEH